MGFTSGIKVYGLFGWPGVHFPETANLNLNLGCRIP
jgi:hypothetical protein